MTNLIQPPIPGIDAAVNAALAEQRRRFDLRALTTALGMTPGGQVNLPTIRYLARRGGEAA